MLCFPQNRMAEHYDPHHLMFLVMGQVWAIDLCLQSMDPPVRPQTPCSRPIKHYWAWMDGHKLMISCGGQ